MNVETFLELKAEAFQRCRFAAAARSLRTPARIAVGTRQLVVPDEPSLVQILRIYHRNLCSEDYDRTTCEILHVSDAPNGAKQVLLTWRNLDGTGAEINRIDASYLCVPVQGSWVVDTVEFVSNPEERLAQGIPFT